MTRRHEQRWFHFIRRWATTQTAPESDAQLQYSVPSGEMQNLLGAVQPDGENNQKYKEFHSEGFVDKMLVDD